MAQQIENFTVKMDIGGVKHSDVIRSANPATAAKKAATKIKNTKLECTAPSAQVFTERQDHEVLLATFPDVRLLLK